MQITENDIVICKGCGNRTAGHNICQGCKDTGFNENEEKDTIEWGFLKCSFCNRMFKYEKLYDEREHQISPKFLDITCYLCANPYEHKEFDATKYYNEWLEINEYLNK